MFVEKMTTYPMYTELSLDFDCLSTFIVYTEPSVCSRSAGKMLKRCCPTWFWHLYCRLGIKLWLTWLTLLFMFLLCHILNVQDYYIQLLRLVIILSYLGRPVNLIQYRGTVAVFNNCKFHNKMVANKFYSSQCGFNAELAILAPFPIHQIILLLLTILMCISKDNYVQSIKRLCISFITISFIIISFSFISL